MVPKVSADLSLGTVMSVIRSYDHLVFLKNEHGFHLDRWTALRMIWLDNYTEIWKKKKEDSFLPNIFYSLQM